MFQPPSNVVKKEEDEAVPFACSLASAAVKCNIDVNPWATTPNTTDRSYTYSSEGDRDILVNVLTRQRLWLVIATRRV